MKHNGDLLLLEPENMQHLVMTGWLAMKIAAS